LQRRNTVSEDPGANAHFRHRVYGHNAELQ
jgi:hypothetical protein